MFGQGLRFDGQRIAYDGRGEHCEGYGVLTEEADERREHLNAGGDDGVGFCHGRPESLPQLDA